MYKLKEYMSKVASEPIKRQELEEVICDAIEKLQKHCPEMFWETAYKLHCIVYGPHFDEYLAKKAVGKMKNVDGTLGEHWSMEQTNAIADQHDIEHKCDFYYVMNMLYSDFYNVLGNDAGTYARMSKAYMCDPDAPEGKPFEVWLAQHKAKMVKM